MRQQSCIYTILIFCIFVNRVVIRETQTHVKKNQKISLLYPKVHKNYPAQFRRIDYYDSEFNRHLVEENLPQV